LKVCLLIATYNNPAALRKVMAGVLQQNRLPDEIVIAEDGLDDITASLVEGFAGIASMPVLHVRQDHIGFRAAKIRNEAIRRSSSDYIILLDGDCVINRHFVSDHLALAEKGYFVQGKRVHVNRNAVEQFDHGYANDTVRLLKMTCRRRISNVHHILRMPSFPAVKNRKLKGIKSCNMSFFRKDILAVNGFNEDFVEWGNEDSELAYRFFSYGLIKKVHPFMAICFHLWHPTNKTFSDKTKKLLAATIASRDYVCKNGITRKN
jgi:glycosyltransferase involved in cell wall biosynthesis